MADYNDAGARRVSAFQGSAPPGSYKSGGRLWDSSGNELVEVLANPQVVGQPGVWAPSNDIPYVQGQSTFTADNQTRLGRFMVAAPFAPAHLVYGIAATASAAAESLDFCVYRAEANNTLTRIWSTGSASRPTNTAASMIVVPVSGMTLEPGVVYYAGATIGTRNITQTHQFVSASNSGNLPGWWTTNATGLAGAVTAKSLAVTSGGADGTAPATLPANLGFAGFSPLILLR